MSEFLVDFLFGVPAMPLILSAYSLPTRTLYAVLNHIHFDTNADLLNPICFRAGFRSGSNDIHSYCGYK